MGGKKIRAAILITGNFPGLLSGNDTPLRKLK
jgi:hypothetical protein